MNRRRPIVPRSGRRSTKPRRGADITPLPIGDCPKCRQTGVPIRDGNLLRHNIPQRVPGPEEVEAMGGMFVFVKCRWEGAPR